MQPLGIQEYPWEIVGIDDVTDLPKSGIDGYTSVFIMVCQLTKMAHFVPCNKEITSQKSADLFINDCYRLHGVPIRSLYLTEILSLLGSFGKHLWES